MEKHEIRVIDGLYAVINTLNSITVSGRQNINGMNACFSVLEGIINAVSANMDQQPPEDQAGPDVA